MGAEVLIPLAISAAAGGAQLYNQDRVASRADRIAAQGIRQQGARQRDVNARVDQEVSRIEGSDPARDREVANAQFMEQLRRSRAAAGGGTPVVGASSRYNDEVADSDAAVQTTAARVADLMARARAPYLQREREAQGFDRLRSDVGMIDRAAQGDAFLNQLRLRGVRANPWIDALAGVAQGYANARLMGAYTGKGVADGVGQGMWELPTDVVSTTPSGLPVGATRYNPFARLPP